MKGDRARLSRIDLRHANLRFAVFEFADLSHADLTGADLDGAILTDANLDDAQLEAANLHDTNMRRASLRDADLRSANLMFAQLNGADLSGANLQHASIYGVSAWRVQVDDATRQKELRITPYEGEQTITVDDIEVAQFIYALTSNERVRRVIDTVTSKVVLILGRFTADRKQVLDSLRSALRRYDLVPVLFDFTKPDGKDLTGTVETLARMARFIIADLTDPSSVPHELATIVPFLRTTPVVLLRLEGSSGYSMVEDLAKSYDKWVIPVREYSDQEALVADIEEFVIVPAEDKLRVLRPSATS